MTLVNPTFASVCPTCQCHLCIKKPHAAPTLCLRSRTWGSPDQGEPRVFPLGLMASDVMALYEAGVELP